jgi:protein phosphatase 1 regulatory subunit 10
MEAYDEWVSQLQSHDALTQTRAEKQPSDTLSWSQSSPSPSTSTAPTPTMTAPSTSTSNNAPDVPDFNDLAGVSSQFYQGYSPYYQSQYGVSSYTPSAWSSQTQPPLSNYSSLNGATSSSSHSLQHPSSHQVGSQSMVMDPALTMNTNTGTEGKGSSPNPYYGRQPLPFASAPPQTTPLSINPSFIHSADFYQNLAAAARAQGSEPSSIFHALPPSMISNLSSPNPSTSTSILAATSPVSRSAPSKSPVTSEERKAQFLAALKPLLAPTSFTGAQAVQSLVNKIEDYGSQEVDADTRKDVLTKIRDGAGNHYFRAWSENLVALDITREWLKAGITAKPGNDLVDTIMPLLHVSHRRVNLKLSERRHSNLLLHRSSIGFLLQWSL